VQLVATDDRPVTMVLPGDAVSLCFDVDFKVDMPAPSYGMSVIESQDQVVVFETSSCRLGDRAMEARHGERHRVRYDFQMNLPPGEYSLGYHVRDTDGLTYAIDEPYAVKVLVAGVQRSTGYAHLAPRPSVVCTRSAEFCRDDLGVKSHTAFAAS
jgi:hypothetical protein